MIEAVYKPQQKFDNTRTSAIQRRKKIVLADNRQSSIQLVSQQYAVVQRKNKMALQDNRTPTLQLVANNLTPSTENKTGLPDTLKTGIENLSGQSMDDVKVHFNSDKPAQLQAHAYAQGTDIHLGPGQEKHLPHEAWHVVQQKQGRVKPTLQMKAGLPVNDDAGLEKEADVMGDKAAQHYASDSKVGFSDNSVRSNPKQILNPVTQGFFMWGTEVINSQAQVEEKFSRSTVGSSKIKSKDKARVLGERWKGLIDMATSATDEGTAQNSKELVGLVSMFISGQRLLSAGITSGGGKDAGPVSVSAMMETGDTSCLKEDRREVVDYILSTKRAFPKQSIYKTAKDSMGAQGYGFFVELKLAESILVSRPHVKVQIGVVNPLDLSAYLGFTPEESGEPVTGLVGGDITVWEHPEAPAPKHSFIQSKTATDTTLTENVDAAANQLASLTASGNPSGKSAQREYTMTGPSFEGGIFVLFTGRFDAAKLSNAALRAINRHPLFVHKVVFQLGGDGFYVVSAEGGGGVFSKTNPFADDVSGLSIPARAEAGSSSGDGKEEMSVSEGKRPALGGGGGPADDHEEGDGGLSEVALRGALNSMLDHNKIAKKGSLRSEIKIQLIAAISRGEVAGITKVADRDSFVISDDTTLRAEVYRLTRSSQTIAIEDPRPAAVQSSVTPKEKAELAKSGITIGRGKILFAIALLVLGFAVLYQKYFASPSDQSPTK